MRRKLFGILLIGAILLWGAKLWLRKEQNKNATSQSTNTINIEAEIPQDAAMQNDSSTVTTVAENLDTPWGIAFLPDKSMFVTERPGRVRFIDSNGNLDPTPVGELKKVKEIGEGGLLGITLHPDFPANHYVYLYYTYNSRRNDTMNRVVRMTYENNQLTGEQIIVDEIPGAANHNGGRIKFGPDKYLYITTGDAQEPSQAQNTNKLGGKILRVTDKGDPAPGNPFNNSVFSYGHRNPQGLAWDGNGRLWATEHGQSALDELNLIEAGKNYGWPTIQGDEQKAEMEKPRLHSGPVTWAPAGSAFIDTSLFFGGLRGQTLYEAVIKDDQITTLKEHLKGQFGRIRDVILSDDGILYLTTSNRDGRGTPASSDDKIIKINPLTLPSS